MDNTMTLTVYDAIKKYIAKEKFPPTMKEICEITGLRSTSNVRYHLDKLEEMGMLKRQPRMARSIVLTEIGG